MAEATHSPHPCQAAVTILLGQLTWSLWQTICTKKTFTPITGISVLFIVSFDHKNVNKGTLQKTKISTSQFGSGLSIKGLCAKGLVAILVLSGGGGTGHSRRLSSHGRLWDPSFSFITHSERKELCSSIYCLSQCTILPQAQEQGSYYLIYWTK